MQANGQNPQIEWNTWKSPNKAISINYKSDWKYTAPNDVMIAKFMPASEYPTGQLTQIALITNSASADPKHPIRSINDIKKSIEPLVSGFDNGKLVSSNVIKRGNDEVLVTTISLIRYSQETMFRSYIFLHQSKVYNLMLISKANEFNYNADLLIKMFDSLSIKQ
jgi:hypothetical protein